MTTRNTDGWIPTSEWCRIYGDNANAVRQRVHRGDWQRGVHWSAPDLRASYVHEPSCREWLLAHPRLKAKVPD